jgi:hypothetical protein
MYLPGGGSDKLFGKIGTATTGAEYTGSGALWVPEPIGAVSCPVTNYCTTATMPPQCDAHTPVYDEWPEEPPNLSLACAVSSAWVEQIPVYSFFGGQFCGVAIGPSYWITNSGVLNPVSCTKKGGQLGPP